MFLLCCKCHILTFCLKLQISLVVGVITVGLSLIYLYDPVTYLIKEISVVGDHNESTLIIIQIFLKVFRHVIVQVVGRLVKNQYFTVGQQGSSQCNLLFLTSGQLICFYINVLKAQFSKESFSVSLDGPLI